MALTLWRFSDGRPGHDIQTRGLVQALREQTPVSVCELPVQHDVSAFWWWLTGRYPPGNGFPAPDVLLGAGHATHAHLLAARRHRGGRIILCMKPSLPLSCFDLCLIPEHDAPVAARNVLLTRGVLNNLRPGLVRDTAAGLIVLGGPSRHYRWNNAAMLEQVQRLLAARPRRHWVLTTSPRTPADLLSRLAGLEGCELMPFERARQGWLAQRLAHAGEAWISEDSISMIYEALTAGTRVGLLAVPRGRPNRVTAQIDALVESSRVSPPGDWQLPRALQQPLNEAARCASWIQQQWLAH